MAISDDDLARLAEDAYAAALPPGFPEGRAVAVKTQRDDTLIVAFRGTVPTRLEDVERDLDAVPVFHEGLGYVHQGFLEGALSIRTLMPALKGARVILTGHSLGGALAIITAGLMICAGMAPVRVVTFGAPRAGGDALRHRLRDTEIRQYRHGADPVPWLPPYFEHVRAPLIEIGTASDDALADHAIAGYVAALGAPAPQEGA